MHRLTFDCLFDIIKLLSNDATSLHSYLLVNRIWFSVSVQFLWTRIQNYGTFLACLPEESKERLLIPTYHPICNYATYVKCFSLNDLYECANLIVGGLSRNDKVINVMNEIFIMFKNQMTLKELDFYNTRHMSFIRFSYFPSELLDGFKNVSTLRCNSNLPHQFYHSLSKVCKNVQTLKVEIKGDLENELIKIISAQKNLKFLDIKYQFYDSSRVFCLLVNHS